MRTLRTVAGRRALQLALLVGGLLMLGFLCGAQAHAAEGTPVVPVHTGHPTAGQESAARHTAPDAVRDGTRDAVRDGTRNAVRDTVGAVTERAVTPVRDVVHVVQTASQALEETRAEAPTPPAAPSVPLPKLPGVSEVPVDPVPAPVGPEPRSHRPGSPAPVSAPTPGKGDHGTTGTGTGARTAVVAGPHAPAYGPDLAPAAPQPAAHIPAQRTTAPVEAPAQPAPGGDTEGVLGKQAVDGTASRHGDAQAVTLDGRAPLRLLPGTTARTDVPGTLERHRDIPVFPG
ncbi:hypothetical protein [Streptomyces sp. NPDC020362]|uniref:hypothetical protein n=1 Tax=unclassified Streptomyces TaxID=2593676 RepID=UPI000AE4481B